MNRTLIRNGQVVSVDAQVGNVPGADVLIEGSKIVAIACGLGVEDARTIDATGMIVMPGFVDTHRHVWQGAMRGVTADWSLLNYLGGIRMSAAACYEPEDMHAAQYQGALEAIDAGVTTIADYCHNLITPEHAEEAIRGLRDAGIRCVWSYGFNAPPLTPQLTLDGRIALARRLAARHFGGRDGLLTLAVAPEEMPLWTSDAAGAQQFRLARELDARVFWHCNCANGPHGRPREASRLHEMGFLDANVVLVHMNYTLADEWPVVAASGAGISCTPETEMQMGMGTPVTVQAREHSVTPSFGIDIVSNNSADMFTALRFGLHIAREQLNRTHDGAFYDGVPIRCDEALRWGTLGGAQTLGIADRTGSLAPGKEADIVLLNANSIRLVGWDRSNPAATILQQTTVADVDTVLVAGRVLKRNGRLVADERRACELLSAAAQRISARVATRGGFYVDPERTFALMARS